jgi:hypothetical protein
MVEEEMEEEGEEKEGMPPIFGEEKKSSRDPPTKELGKPCSHSLTFRSKEIWASVEGQKKWRPFDLDAYVL